MKTISRYIMTLALLLTAVTGAWAEEPKVYDSGDVELFSLQEGDILMPGVTLKNSDVNNIAGVNLISKRYSIDGVISQYSNSISSIPFSIGENGLLTAQLAGNGPYNCMPITEDGKAGNAWVVTDVFAEPNYKTILIGGTTAPNTITVTPVAGKTNEWTFTMPAFDVEIAPIYAPTAVFATDGEPTAIEGIIAGEAKDIVKAGTVATTKIGEADPIAQGTVMYAVTTENKKPTSTTGFNATVPTGAVLTGSYTENQTVYVWYYIKGIDAAEGETATAENTFNDSEICETPLTVTVLSNKFNIQFTAANANTIEAGKATVTVGGTAATVTEGKLEGVKMGSEVKVKANTGYKFRKVEVKKKAAAAPATITVTWNYDDITGSGNSFTKDGVTITAGDIDFDEKNFKGGGTFTTTLGNFTKIEVTTSRWQASGEGWSGSTWTGNASSVSFSDDIKDRGEGTTKFVFTIEPTN